MPGSPPSRTTEPATSPPPSTRSRPGSPVSRREPASPRASVIVAGSGASGATRSARSSSTYVFHSPQSGQRPSHLDDEAPQDWHAKTVDARGAMTSGEASSGTDGYRSEQVLDVVVGPANPCSDEDGVGPSGAVQE